jgi:hypothetical protein
LLKVKLVPPSPDSDTVASLPKGRNTAVIWPVFPLLNPRHPGVGTLPFISTHVHFELLNVILRYFGAKTLLKNTKITSPSSQPVFTALVASGWLTVRLKTIGAASSARGSGSRIVSPQEVRTARAANNRKKCIFFITTSLIHHDFSSLNPLKFGLPSVWAGLWQIISWGCNSTVSISGASYNSLILVSMGLIDIELRK